MSVTAAELKSIWKYPINVSDRIELSMPKGAEILCVQMQYEFPCIYALVNVNEEKEVREFRVVDTGHPLQQYNGKYIGTFQLHGGDLVFHLFESL